MTADRLHAIMGRKNTNICHIKLFITFISATYVGHTQRITYVIKIVIKFSCNKSNAKII